VLAGLAIVLVLGFIGIDSLAVLAIARVKGVVQRQDGVDLGAVPKPSDTKCCTTFSAVTYGPGLTAWWSPPSQGRPSLVLVHGYGGNVESLGPLAGALRERGYGVLATNMGYVTDAHLYSGGELEARDIGRATRWVRERAPGPVVAWGFSAGGHASLLAAAERQPMDAVIAEGAPVAMGDKFVGGLRSKYPSWLFPVPVLTTLFRIMTRHAPADLSSMRRPRVPALVISDGNDGVVDASEGRLLARRTNGELWTIPGAGHVAGFETLGDEYLAHTLDFVERVTQNGSGRP
jgi:hypothetical protein